MREDVLAAQQQLLPHLPEHCPDPKRRCRYECRTSEGSSERIRKVALPGDPRGDDIDGPPQAVIVHRQGDGVQHVIIRDPGQPLAPAPDGPAKPGAKWREHLGKGSTPRRQDDAQPQMR